METLHISQRVQLPLSEVEMNPIRASGPGGQNVNKLASAIHLRFDIRTSSLPELYKERLLALSDQRITQEGVVVLKAQEARTQEANREAALARLATLIRSVASTPKRRIATKPSRASQRRRVDEKKKRGQHKALRGRVV